MGITFDIHLHTEVVDSYGCKWLYELWNGQGLDLSFSLQELYRWVCDYVQTIPKPRDVATIKEQIMRELDAVESTDDLQMFITNVQRYEESLVNESHDSYYIDKFTHFRDFLASYANSEVVYTGKFSF